MLQMQWSTQQIKQCELETGQALLQEEQLLVSVNHDFGRLVKGQAEAVCKPTELKAIQKFLQYASREKLPITIRGNGLGQSGQSLAVPGGVSLDVSQLNTQVRWESEKLVVGCSASWKDIIAKSLEQKKLPYIFPYNTNLTLGGVLSVGGLGSSSFKAGVIASHVEKISVVTPMGDFYSCGRHQYPDLYDACLTGAGLFGVIYDATINLRSCKSMVRMYTLVYDDYSAWINDQFILKNHCDYLEAVISAERQCITTIGIEYDEEDPDLGFLDSLHFSHLSVTQDMTILDYTNRHDGRFIEMRETGKWAGIHPWYECYVSSSALTGKLDEIVNTLDDALGGIYHVFPVGEPRPRYFMLPEEEQIVTFNVLTPGLNEDNAEDAVKSLQRVDEILLGLGGKRYISGWFGSDVSGDYWLKHYGAMMMERNKTKARYDPDNILCSQLFSRDILNVF